jgi:uncharacterized iron-regulated protein
MSVYVDEPKHVLGLMVMCHMVADTIEELNEMADAIGVDRKWIQYGTLVHYDICKTKRALAVNKGAIETTSREIVKRFCRGKEKSDGE